LTIHAPRDAGESFQGRVEIKPVDAGTERVEFPLSVKVLPVTLTENPPIHCFTWNFPHIIEAQPKWWRAHLEDLAKHGVDVCMISSLNHLPRPGAKPDGSMPAEMDFAKLDRLLESTKELFRLYWINLDIFEKAKLRTDLIGLEFGSSQYERAFKQWLRTLLNHLRSRGLSNEQFLINPYDESVDERCRLLARWVKEVDPKVRIVIDSSTPDTEVARKMNELTDVWVPHYRQFFPPEMKPFHQMIRDSNKPRWAYFYSEGSNDKTQDPARHYLAKFWWAFANDVGGMGYWAQQYYGDPWHRRDWKDSYDTALWYPMEGGVAPSRRWEAWRRGWQDYLLLTLTKNALAHDKAQTEMLYQKVKQVVDYPGDQALADAVRAWLKEKVAARPGDLGAVK
jgi:hypothetical protein